MAATVRRIISYVPYSNLRAASPQGTAALTKQRDIPFEAGPFSSADETESGRIGALFRPERGLASRKLDIYDLSGFLMS